MDDDLLIQQHDKLGQLAQELASASEALAASIFGDETAIPAPNAYEILASLMETLMAMSKTTHALRARLVASLDSTRIILADIDLTGGETRDPTRSVLTADAAILSSVTSLELAERCLSGARSAISGKTYEPINGYAAPHS